jgi:hypothetical protein
MSTQSHSHSHSHAPGGSQKLPDIPWTENEGRLIWSLITEMEKPENFKVLLGKKDKKEVCLLKSIPVFISNTIPEYQW